MIEELKAEEWSEKHWSNPELTRKNLAYQAYIAGATEATKELQEENEILERRIVRAKECMKKLLFVVDSEHLNCKGLIQDAEDFIHNRMCPLRKQGQHCITKEPCIMCDKE